MKESEILHGWATMLTAKGDLIGGAFIREHSFEVAELEHRRDRKARELIQKARELRLRTQPEYLAAWIRKERLRSVFGLNLLDSLLWQRHRWSKSQ